MTKGECVDEQSRQRPEYGSYRTCLIALLGLISVLTAAAVNVSVDGWRPQLGALSSESGVTACARLILTLGGMFAVGCAISIQPGRVALLGPCLCDCLGSA